jgi:hypothetical protein
MQLRLASAGSVAEAMRGTGVQLYVPGTGTDRGDLMNTATMCLECGTEAAYDGHHGYCRRCIVWATYRFNWDQLQGRRNRDE